MKGQRLRARDYMEHMNIAVQRISTYLQGKSKQDFDKDTLLQDALIRNLENLGEAAKNFKLALPDAETRFPAIPFDITYATRNQLAHGYFKVDLEIVWKVTQSELPNLQRQLQAALAAWPSDLT